MPYPIYHVDAFAEKPFTGNPAAVVLLDKEQDPIWMQALAAEMNLSETAFVRPLEDARFELRWFTPSIEVDLCGHATLAAAHVMRQTGTVGMSDTICFSTRSGNLPVQPHGDKLQLDFPLTPAADCDPPAGLVNSFRADGQVIQPRSCGRNSSDYLLVLDTERQVRRLDVDMVSLCRVECRGVIVTAIADAGQSYDFVSRFFAPAVGVNEDPVTGSAHCCLADYWQQHFERTELIGYQASKRGGFVTIRVCDDRVLLRGSAVTIFAGTLEV